MKRILAFALLICLALFVPPGCTDSASGIEYKLVENGAQVVRGTWEGTTLVIPKRIDGYPVVSVADFDGIKTLTQVIIPKGVTEIGLYAFNQCEALTDVRLPDTLISIGEYAFHSTAITSITLPSNLTKIGVNAFQNTPVYENVDGVYYVGEWVVGSDKSLASAAVREGTVGIADSSFAWNRSLIEVCLPESLRYIGSNAFAACYSLERIELPSGLISVGEEAFQNCASLTLTDLPDSLQSLGQGAFAGSLGFFADNLILPHGITAIYRDTFYGNNLLRAITIPVSVTHIEEGAFYYTNLLTDIYYEGTVAQWEAIKKDKHWDSEIAASKNGQYTVHCLDGSLVGEERYAFFATLDDGGRCVLTEAQISTEQITIPPRVDDLPAYVTVIGEGVFEGMEILEKVTISRITEIGARAFKGCRSLSFISYAPVEIIGEEAFAYCSSLSFIRLPKSLRLIGASAFEGCTSLSHISFSGTVEEWNAVEKGSDWCKDVPDLTVFCSDGSWTPGD